MTKNLLTHALLFGAIAVWSFNFLLINQKTELKSRAPMLIQLTTSPESVLVSIDNNPYMDGNYIRTPFTIPMRAGKRVIKITRPGYSGHRITLDGAGGQTYNLNKIVLQKDPRRKFHSLKIQKSEDFTGDVNINVNNGYHRGTLPVVLEDLMENKKYDFTFVPSENGQSSAFTCEFKTTGNTADLPSEMTLRKIGNIWSLPGCRRK